MTILASLFGLHVDVIQDAVDSILALLLVGNERVLLGGSNCQILSGQVRLKLL